MEIAYSSALLHHIANCTQFMYMYKRLLQTLSPYDNIV